MPAIDWAGVRSRHRLADVARRSGLLVSTDLGDTMVCCPMPGHDDTTPSMALHLSTDRYHCFGCGAGGDVVQWIRDIYGVGAKEAVGMLDAPGPLPAPPAGTRSDHSVIPRASAPRAEPPDPARTPETRVLAATLDAWGYYRFGALHDAGLTYLAARGIDVGALEAQTKEPVVGHTPFKAPDQLTARLRAKGYGDDELVDAGLARRVPGAELIDSYRHRVILPVTDTQGRVVGLIGRYDGERRDVPKYLNPPRTAIYDKSVNLYRPTQEPLDPDAQVVVVEGTLDAVAVAAVAAKAGRSSTFAPVTSSGLALSDAQLRAICSIHPGRIVLAGDGDRAGREASARWATDLLGLGRESLITDWPDGHDASSWMAEHGTQGLVALTCPSAATTPRGKPRPRYSGSVVATTIASAATTAHQAAAPTVLSPLHALPPGAPQRRYARAAAGCLTPLLIAAHRPPEAPPREAAEGWEEWESIRAAHAAHVDAVAGAVACLGQRLLPEARQAWVGAAAQQIAGAGLGPSGWAERKIAWLVETMTAEQCGAVLPDLITAACSVSAPRR